MSTSLIDTIMEKVHEARCRNEKPKYLYIGQHSWQDLRREMSLAHFAGTVAQEPERRPEYMGMEVILVNEAHWIDIGVER
jgi:hypothetical protein